MEVYIVKPGDSVDAIARKTGVPVETLIYNNQIPYPYRLAIGQALFIEIPKVHKVNPLLYVSGYAYPFIEKSTLERTLPNLTALYVFSYGFTKEGELVPPMSVDTTVVETTIDAGVRPVLVLTPLGEDGKFNNNLISVLVANEELQKKLLWEIGSTMEQKGYGGLDIDFEYIKAEDRIGFVNFVSFATQVMNVFGYPVSVALAPKTTRDQKGLLYEGIDYRRLGAVANRVLLMTYEWGYSQGPPMAVAPIHMVRRVVDYAVTEIPSHKISLGIPNYGYDWPLPYVAGETKAKTINNLEAIQIAIDYGVEIQFDELAQTPYFRYWQYGTQHEVWFEDVRSLKAKFELVREYGLSGIGVWQLMNYFRVNWLTLEGMKI